MATVSEKPGGLAVPDWKKSDIVDENVDRYLARRLRAVGADYKSVAAMTFALAAAVGFVLWLALGVVADHWFVPGGLPRTARFVWLGIAAVAFAAAAVRWLLPLVRYRVNLVYAARTIERVNPELHNDVVNTVLVRAHPEGNAPVVVTSLEKRAAKRLSKLPADVVADRTTALRLAYLLAALVAIACLYAVLSPKSLALSMARLGTPWARIQPPTRVRIDEPRLAWTMPGAGKEAASRHAVELVDSAASIVRNRQLVVQSRIFGLRPGEHPVVEAASLDDDGSVDRAAAWKVEMSPVAGSEAADTFEALLPGDSHGLAHSIAAAIVAGDGRSEEIRVSVIDAPSMLVRQLKYAYPPYTHREPETVEWQGDISAIEGTKVTVVAESNQPLEMASIDFGCEGRPDLKLRIDPKDLARASESFELKLAADRSVPWQRSYRLLYRTKGPGGDAGDAKDRGIEHRIEVAADLVPEIRITRPDKPTVRVPPDKPVPIGVEAIDPDFALRKVSVEVEIEKQGERTRRPAVVVLDREFAGLFKGVGRITPVSVGAVAGDKIHYRGVAADVKSPTPNVAMTEWFTLEIDASAPPQKGDEKSGSPHPQDQNQQDPEQNKSDQQQNDAQRKEPPRQPDQPQNEQKPGDQKQGDQKQDQKQGEQKQSPDGNPGNSGDKGSGSAQKGGAGESKPGAGNTAGSSTPNDRQNQSSGGKDDPSREAKDPSDGTSRGEQGRGGRSDGPSEGKKEGDSKGEGTKGQGSKGDRTKGEGSNGQGTRSDGKQGEGEAASGEARQAGKQGVGKEEKGREGPGGNSERQSVASDGTNDGEAIERILQERNRDEEKNGGKPSQGEAKASPGKDPSQTQEDGKKGRDGQQPQGQQPEGTPQGDEGQPQDAAASKSNPSDCQGSDGKPCGKKECPTCKGGSGSQAGGSAGGSSGKQGEDGQGEGSQPGGASSRKEAGEQTGRQAGDKAGEKAGGGGQPGGQRSGQAGAGGNKPGEKKPGGDQVGGEPGEGGKEGGEESGSGIAGGQPQAPGAPPQGPAASKEAEWGQQDLSHARNAVDLAVDHLKKSLDRGQTDVLDALGWTPEQARAFLDRWEQMSRTAKAGGPLKQEEFDRAVRSLGLTPDGVRRNREVPEDARGGQAEGRRSRPPAEYREQFKAFTQGAQAQ